jgi:hypothetical protein
MEASVAKADLVDKASVVEVVKGAVDPTASAVKAEQVDMEMVVTMEASVDKAELVD